MGSLTEKQIEDAIEALATHDVALAKRIIVADDQVDTRQREIEEKAIITIAQRQPMAVDLREIVGALRICNDLERIGDLAENLAKRVLILVGELPSDEAMLQLERMAKLVLFQLRGVLHSYAHRVDEALDVWRRDAEIDPLHISQFRELLTYMMENPRNITFCAHLLFARRTSSGWAITSPISQKQFIIACTAAPSRRNVRSLIS
jgi:phosphate transport system protein